MRRYAACLFALFLGVGCSSEASRENLPAPNFALRDLSGQTVALDSFRGHPIMIDFWATWCGPCQQSIPRVQQFYLQHKDDGLVVLGLNVDDDPSPVLPFVKHFQMTYPVLLAGGSSVSNDFGVDGLPTFVFVDAQGRIAQSFQGFGPEMPAAWEAEYQRLAANH